MRIDDLERLVKIHSDMLNTLSHHKDHSGNVNYSLAESTRAAEAIAKKIQQVVNDGSS